MLNELLQVYGDGATLSGAIDRALEHFSCQRSDLEIDIIQSPRQGFLGFFGKKEARIKARLISREYVGRLILQRLLSLSGLPGRVEMSPKGRDQGLSICSDQAGLIVGRHGQTLDSLEVLTNHLLQQACPGASRLVVDCQGYRRRRHAQLQGIAANLVARARKSGRPVSSDALPDTQVKIMQRLIGKNKDLHIQTRNQGALCKLVVASRA